MKKLITGGAGGSDSIFATLALELGIDVDIHSFEGHNLWIPKTEKKPSVITHSKEELSVGLASLKEANKTLKRKIPDGYVGNLLRRNYYQIEETDCIIAIGMIGKNNIVEGGTGWAVEMAKVKNVPIFVFDMISNCWWVYSSYSGYIFRTVQVRPNMNEYNNITAIGSRDISPVAFKEIKILFEELKEELSFEGLYDGKN